MYVNAGNLNKKIDIIKFEGAKDKEGGFNTQSLGTGYKHKRHGVNQRKFGFFRNKDKIFNPRAEKSIDKDMSIKFRGNLYNIIYINNYNFKDEYTEIITELTVK